LTALVSPTCSTTCAPATRWPWYGSIDWGVRLRELLDVVETLKKRGVALLSLEETIDTSSAAGELVFHVFRCHRAVRAASDRRAHPRRHGQRPIER